MKRILICGMLLVLATSLSFAQRSRGVGPSTGGIGPAVGQVGPVARMPGPMSTSPVRPDTIGADRVPNHVSTTSPDTRTVGPDASRVAPDAKAPGNSGKQANPAAAPDRAVIPDANGVSDHARINPNQ